MTSRAWLIRFDRRIAQMRRRRRKGTAQQRRRRRQRWLQYERRAVRAMPSAEPVVSSVRVGGNCPVQGWGPARIGDREVEVYFRARGRSWSFELWAIDPARPEAHDPDGWNVREPDWTMYRMWGDSEYAAGWMPFEVADEIIADAIRRWSLGFYGGDCPA